MTGVAQAAGAPPRRPVWLGRLIQRLPLLVAAIFFCGSSTPPPVRMALIIGNGAYSFSDPLPNAPSDARKLAEKLGRLGFEVQADTLNLKKNRLARTVAAFGDRLRAAGPNVIGFFYYAGHAAQDAYGVNYLLPIDAKARTPAEIRAEGTPVQALLQAMEDSNNAINIVVLDACRDWYRRERTPQDPKGLHDMGLHASVLIAYATRADETADEGANLDSSPFSHRLLEALDEQQSDPVVLLLDDVKGRVYSDTDAGQSPMLVDGLIQSGRWSFASASLGEVASKPQPVGETAVSVFLAKLDRARLVTFFRGRDSIVDILLKRRDLLQKYEINTPNRLAHFLGAIGFETGGFKLQEERFGYSTERLRRLFPTRVTSDALAQQIAGDPEKVANVVYADRLGNGAPESGDGWRYRGRGLFFITGRANYERYGKMVGVDLLSSPDLANDPEIGFAVAAAVWSTARANPAAESDDLALVTKRFRGASNDLAPRAIWVAQAKRAVAPSP